MAHQLPKEKKPEQYDLLFSLLNLVQEPVQWDDLTASVSPAKLIGWCEKYGMILRMEVMPDRGEGVRLRTAQIEVMTFYLIYRLWQSVLLPSAATQDVLEQEQEERFRFILLLLRRYSSRNLVSPDWTLRVAAREDNLEHQRLLLKTFLQEVVNQQLHGLTPAIRLLHQPRQTLMEAESPIAIAYWQLAERMLKPEDTRHYHICTCGRSFCGRPNRKYCSRCDRRTEHSRRTRGTAPNQSRHNRRAKRASIIRSDADGSHL